MPVTDQIADLLARIRNAGTAGHKHLELPKTKLKLAIAEILKDQGYIDDVKSFDEGVQGKIQITLRYYKRQPIIKEMHKVSKPGRRVYVSADNLPRVKNGLGVAIVSTSKGVMTDKKARKENVGGEVLCTIW